MISSRSGVFLKHNRKFVYYFLGLPYHVKLSIAKKLNLLTAEGEGNLLVPDIQFYKLIFRRAKGMGILDEFYREVEQAHNERRIA